MRVGVPELIIILIIILVIFGGAKLSGIGRTIGKTIKDFKSELKEDNADKTTSLNEDRTSK